MLLLLSRDLAGDSTCCPNAAAPAAAAAGLFGVASKIGDTMCSAAAVLQDHRAAVTAAAGHSVRRRLV